MGRGGLEDLLPLSPLQEGLLFHAQFDGEQFGDGAKAPPDVYAVQLVLALAGPVEAAGFRAAGRALLERHANLRAGFRFSRTGRPAQLLPRTVELPWRELDLSDLVVGEREARLADLVNSERVERFDLTRPPALRLVLVRLGKHDYRLIFTSHHILLDGWSTPVLVRELLMLYASRGDDTALPPPTPYRDYLAWLLKQDRAAAHAAWDSALEGLSCPTLLAGDLHPGGDLVDGSVVEHVVELPTELSADLGTAARLHGCTLNTVLQLAWALVLAAATGSADVVFGTTVAGRPAEIPGVENMIGLLINTVPVRVRLSPDESLHGALRRLQDEQSALLGSQHVGLADIQRRTGLTKLFDTLVVVENQPCDMDGADFAGVWITGVEAHDATHYPLTVVATLGERLRLALHHRTDTVTSAEAAVLAGYLERVLVTVAADMARPVGRVDLASAEDVRHVLALGTAKPPVPALSLPELFAAQVARTPDAPAVRAGGAELSYAELDLRARRLAHVLRARGVGPERVVAIALPRSVEAVVAFLAVQKAGGACLPLDLDHPTDRLAYVLADAVPALVLTTAAGAARLPAEVPLAHLVLDGPDSSDGEVRLGDDTGADCDPELGADDLGRAAYVVYTSGSTGRPKGVVVSHTGIASLVATAQERLGVGPGSSVGQFAALSFDVAVWELAMALLSGGCLVVVPAEHRTDLDALLTFVHHERLSVLAIPPSLLAVVPPDALLPERLTLLVGSEMVPAELVHRWSDRVQFVVAYGVTESTVNQTLWIAPSTVRGRSGIDARSSRAARVPIGRPDPGARVYVLGSGLLPQPPGMTGELYIGGDGLVRGYVGRPELTAERFVADPFGPPGSRMYRTGDLARWSAEGELEFLGRSDDQVQIRGFRVEPGEVESMLLRHPGVVAAAVVAGPDPARSDESSARTEPNTPMRLVGYVVPVSGMTADPERWRQYLATELPEYMIPVAFVSLPELPRTPNGKLDRAALPAPTRGEGGVKPRTAVEELLLRLVCEVLRIEQAGVTDDFFNLGGDSISSIVLVNRARREGLALTPRAVFGHRTVARLARVARSVGSTEPEDPDHELGRVVSTPVFGWLYEHGDVIDAYNQSMLMQVPAEASLERLVATLQAVLDHHAMLRARLLRSAEGWELDVPPPGALRADGCLTRADAKGLDPEALEVLINEHLMMAMSRLDPDAGVMVQAVWFDAGPERAGRLLCVIHHLVIDGVSWRILVPDLAVAWNAVVAGRPVELEPVATSFRGWARVLSEEAHRPGRCAELSLWRQVLEPADPPLSPVPIVHGRDTAATTGHLTVVLPPEGTTPLLTEVPAAFHAGINDILLTALGLAVGDWRERRGRAGGEAVLITLEGHGREDSALQASGELDISRTVGWFTSTFPVRLDPGPIDRAEALRGGPAAGHAVRQIKEQLRALPDNGIGFGLLRYVNSRTREQLAPLRQPQIEFNYLGRFTTASAQNLDSNSFSVVGRVLSAAADDEMPVRYVVEIDVLTRDGETGPELVATWSWPEAVLPEDDVRELADGWFSALGALTKHIRALDTAGLPRST